METAESLSLLGLSKKEEKVLVALQGGADTPLLLARATNVSRTAVYAILQNLKKRGLAHTHITNSKKHWGLRPEREIEEALYEAKRALLKIPEGREEVMGVSDSTVVVHRGKEAVLNLIVSLARDHRNERLYTIQGNSVQPGWEEVVGTQKINEFNSNIRDNAIITETILPYDWFEDHLRDLGNKEGIKWAKGFTERAFAAFEIDKDYFNHAGQIFMFKDSLYLMAMNEAIVIEIRHSELQKMIKQLFSYIEEHADRLNVSEKLGPIIAAMESEK